MCIAKHVLHALLKSTMRINFQYHEQCFYSRQETILIAVHAYPFGIFKLFFQTIYLPFQHV